MDGALRLRSENVSPATTQHNETRAPTMNIGDRVKLTKVPDDLPEGNRQLETLFHGCVGKTFTVAAIDEGLLELHVGEAFEKPADYHRIWVEPNLVKRVEA